jgi:outer membrane protein insertion porin family
MCQLINKKYYLILISLLLTACTGLRNLPPGEKLYTGADVELEQVDRLDKKKKRFIKSTAENAVRPEPNKSYLGMRPQLWLYNMAGEAPKGKIGKWLKKTGTAPVFFSSVKPSVTSSVIDASLFNIGIFNAHTGFEIIDKERTSKLIYTSHIHKPYTISAYNYAITHDSLSVTIVKEEEDSFIIPGKDYNLNMLKNERERMDALLKDKGYFYFNPDYLLFKADTSATDQTVSLTIHLKDSLDENALTAYRINQVTIDQDFSLNADTTTNNEFGFNFQNAIFRGEESAMNIKPRMLLQSVFLRKGELYSRRNHTITLNRLMSLGNFKFVQVKFSDSDTTAPDYLDVEILLTTMPNRSFRASLDIVSKSNNFAGPHLNLSLLNRNTFGSAELLKMSLAGSFEAQLGGGERLYSYSIGPGLELIIPRFVLPFNIKQNQSLYVPKTSISLSYNFMSRIEYFDMHTFKFSFGYRWKENIRKEHEFNPISLSFASISKQSDVFRELLESNSYLKVSYEEQFIAGWNYTFTYNEQVMPLKRMQYLMIGTAETAGNLFSLGKIIAGEQPSPEDPSKVIGNVYSQFAKLSVDGRGFYRTGGSNKLAMRIFAGAGLPYGNSDVLPYTKQFFSGGSTSIRAFQINSVGPGTYFQDGGSTGFLQLGGEIKLEANAEYRFTIYNIFKGALFVDAGNVWLHKSNPSTAGGEFKFSTFYKELGVGAGFGVRLDISFFLLRFDLAMPLRKPWLADGDRWVFDQIQFGHPDWRRDNLVLNVAIGYPF